MAGINPDEMLNKLNAAIAAYNRHDMDAYFASIDPDFVLHDPFVPQPVKGKEATRKLTEAVLRAFPDAEVRILRAAVTGDTLATEYTVSGTFKGPMELPQGTLPPTGRRVEYTIASFERFNSKGLVVESRRYYDPTVLRQAFGLKS